MEREGRLEVVKDALRVLVDGLDRNDTVAIVTFGDEARVVLGPTPAPTTTRSSAPSNAPSGRLDEPRGRPPARLRAGPRELTENGIDRVVLASDGVANVGLTDPESILGSIRDDAAAGIELVSVGVGMGNYNDVLLEQLADQGDGFYAYVNTLDEAQRLFAEDLTGTLQTVALDARAQVEFDPEVVAAYRLVGYENRDMADEDFTNDEVDAGAIGAGHCGHGAVRAAPARGRRTAGSPGHGQPALDRPGPRLVRGARPATCGRAISPARSRRRDPFFRFDAIVASPRPRSCAAARGPGGWPWPTSRTSPTGRRSACPRRTRSTTFLDLLDAASRTHGRTEQLPRPGGASWRSGPPRARQAGSPASGSWTGWSLGLADRARPWAALDLAVGAPPAELAGTTFEDAPDGGVVGAGELHDEGAHLRVLRPRGVGDVRWPEHGLAGRDPRCAPRRRRPSRRPR